MLIFTLENFIVPPAFQEIESITYKSIILPVVLYSCETLLRLFENKVFRKIFGTKREKNIGEWGKLNNSELHALYPSSNITRKLNRND